MKERRTLKRCRELKKQYPMRRKWTRQDHIKMYEMLQDTFGDALAPARKGANFFEINGDGLPYGSQGPIIEIDMKDTDKKTWLSRSIIVQGFLYGHIHGGADMQRHFFTIEEAVAYVNACVIYPYGPFADVMVCL